MRRHEGPVGGSAGHQLTHRLANTHRVSGHVRDDGSFRDHRSCQGPSRPGHLTKSGTTLKFGKTANVQAGDWIGGLKVTALEKAPASDFKALGFRGAGSVYYLRYEVTYVAGTPTNPISASNIGLPGFYPSDARGQFELTWGGRRQRVSMHVNPSSLQSNEPFNPSPSFKSCRQVVYQDTGGHFHNYTDELAVGETATNLCLPFVVDKGTLTQVHYGAMLADGSSYSVTWK